MFEEMNAAIQEDAVRLLMRGQPVQAREEQTHRPDRSQLSASRKDAGTALKSARDQLSSNQKAAQAAGEGKAAPVVKKVKPGRNDPCWCGSGKKYKNCHMQADLAKERGEG